jgi:Arc/MetJ-type ribon-helix-helix transcriptional regulator
MPLVRTHVVLPEEVVEEIDALVGRRGRSRFISEALVTQLANARQRRLAKAVCELAKVLPDEGPPEWATSESIRQWVHDLRHFESDREKRIREKWLEREEEGGAESEAKEG